MSKKNRRLPPSGRAFPPAGAEVKNLAVGEALEPTMLATLPSQLKVVEEITRAQIVAPVPAPVVTPPGIFGGYPNATSDWWAGTKGH